jgi:hypothetical protein
MTRKTVTLPLVACAGVLAGATLLLAQNTPPRPTAGAVLKRWNVPPLDVPKGELRYPTTNSVAINDDGSRAIVDNHPAVDVWFPEKLTYVRVLPKAAEWKWGCNVIIARDASRFYHRNDPARKLDTYGGGGAPVGSTPQIGFAPAFGLKRPGHDFAARDYVMGAKVGSECGVYELDPDGGPPRNVVKIKDIWDVEKCSALVRLPDGDFIAHYNPSGGVSKRRGLYTLARDGAFTAVAGVPSKDLTTVSDLALSRDGRYLALRGRGRLEVWDREQKRLVLDWRQEYRDPRAVRFTGDGRLAVLSVKTSIKDVATSNLAGGAEKNSARLDVLEVPSPRAAGQLDLADFDAVALAFAFSPNGKRLVVADPKMVAVYDADRAFPGK